MKVVVTGAGGFLGSRVADALLQASRPLGEPSGDLDLLLVDVAAPAPRADPRTHVLALDLAAPGAAERLLADGCDVLFHLAAVVSGQAESDFDLGMRVNLDATRALLEAARRHARGMRLVFASTVAVFGQVPGVLDDLTAVTPQTSYGTAKAMCELLVNDYSRRGFVDGRSVRLPTVTVRAGVANTAVTSFVSGIVREPLNGQDAVCPVPAAQEVWLASPRSVVANFLHAATVPSAALGAWRVVALPGLRVSVADMLAALRAVAGERVAARVHFEQDATLAAIIAGLPMEFDNSRALALGFVGDSDFEGIIRAYIDDDLGGSIPECRK